MTGHLIVLHIFDNANMILGQTFTKHTGIPAKVLGCEIAPWPSRFFCDLHEFFFWG